MIKRDENITKIAEQMYKEGMKLVQIAKEINVPEGTVRRWKSQLGWSRTTERANEIASVEKKEKRSPKNVHVRKRKRGAQPFNKNGKGPPGNKNAEKHGFFSKHLPSETLEIIESTSSINPIDILWQNIQIQYAAIIRAQSIMFVKDAQDKTIEKIEEKDGNVIGERFEVQQAWDKQANFLSAQSRAMKTLEGMISKYDELLRSDLATQEQKERINLLKAKVNQLNNVDSSDDEKVVIINDV